MTYATTPDGTRIAYQLRGNGAPLVLLAGQANNHHWWDLVRTDFHPARSTLTLDYRGTGDSDKPDTPPHSTELFAQDVIAVLDDLASTGPTSTAHPWRPGSPATRRPPPSPSQLPDPRLHLTRRPAQHRTRQRRQPGSGSDPARRRASSPAGSHVHTAMARRPPRPAPHPRRPPHALPLPAPPPRSSNRHNAWDLLPIISAPTLVLHGTDDLLNPTANAPLLADRIPNAPLHLIPDARHAYFEEARAHAGRLVLDFLAPPPHSGRGLH